MSELSYQGERRQHLKLPVDSSLDLTITYDQAERRFVVYVEQRRRRNIPLTVAMAIASEGTVPRIEAQYRGSWVLHVAGAGFPVQDGAQEQLRDWLAHLRQLSLQAGSPNPTLCRAVEHAR